MIKSIIIEDEAVAARRLAKMLEKHPNVTVLEQLHSVEESVKWLQQNDNPDLIFLDIQLGDGISFEIFEQVQPKSVIIFTTAYDKYALKAFKLNSIDYLLKPIHPTELSNAIHKYVENTEKHSAWDIQTLQSLLNYSFENQYRERFLVKIGTKLKTISSNKISLIFSENKGTYATVLGRHYLLDFSMDEMEDQLNPDDFFRISRQAIVNVNHIQEIQAYSGSRLILSIDQEKEKFVVSRERVRDFKQWLEK